MLVRADAIPVVEMVKAAEAVDFEAAALWLHMGLWDALGEMIDDNRPEIDAVWKSVVAAKSDRARGVLVRKALERRVAGGEIDDVVKAAAGLSLVRGYVAKEETPEQRRAASANEPRQRGRWVKRIEGMGELTERGGKERTKVEGSAYDALHDLTQRNEGLQSGAKDVATALNDRGNAPYSQMRVVGNALVATGHPKAMAAGGVVRVAAEVGPSAEDVLGTHLRRVAYRYRGTEKRPDRQLLRETKEAQAYIAASQATPRTDEERRVQANLSRQLEERKPGEWAKGAVAYRLAQANQPGAHLSEDQIEMNATGDIAVSHLMRQLPSQAEAELSQEAGRTPPSVGVLIDRDGDVVSEAMGYQGDHYVPFDLKNLKRLQGGSYVRTRALGGPTSEDIYTGLLTGARQMTVVSRSGVFTVEFDPDLRGGRRYSDKARQMVDRYSRLLDVVEGGRNAEGETLYTQDIPEDRQRELRREALEASDYDEDEAKVRFNRRLKQERVKAGIGYTEEDLDRQVDEQLRDWARNRAQAGQAPGRAEMGRAREQIREEVRASAREQRQQTSVQRLRLNAEGYFRAMQSLKREFPYYVRDVSYESLPDFEERRRTRQQGEAPLGFGAPGAAASNTHVRRRALVPASQERAYRGEKTEETTTESQDASAPTGAGAPKGEATAADGATFADTLRNERFQDRLATSLESLHVVNAADIAGVEPLEDERGNIPNRQGALGLNGVTYMKWLIDPRNEITHGRASGIARFFTEDATDAELTKVSDGLESVIPYGLEGPQFNREKLESTKQVVDAIARARTPYAKAEGPLALHAPDRENPKPYPVPEVVSQAMAPDEKFDKVRRSMSADDAKMDEALSWAEGVTDARAAARLRQDVNGFKAAVAWGNARAEAKRKGEDPPLRPDDVEVTVSPADADEWAASPEASPVYRDLARKQKAWAWVYTKRLRDALRGVTGGGAAPKAQPLAIETGKRAPSRRQVVWHSPDDPLSQALAKRLSRRR